MSKLNVTLDLDFESPKFNFDLLDDDNPFCLEIAYGAKKVEDYENLSFGYTLKENENVVTEVVRPESNVTYIRSDQEYIDFNKLEYVPSINDDEIFNFDIDAWCEDAGQRYEGTYSFQITIPAIVDPYPDGQDATPESVGKTDLI